jgi:hypothetical protein
MRLAIGMLALLALALGPPAFAKTNQTAPGQIAAAGAGSSGAGSANGNAFGKDKADPPGKSGADGPPGQSDNPPTPDKPPPAALEQDEALRVVEQREALPLAQIVALAETRTGAHVVDARLMRVDGVLLYRLILLSDVGRSWRLYLDARTGTVVEPS